MHCRRWGRRTAIVAGLAAAGRTAVAQEPTRPPHALGEIVVSAEAPISEAAATTRRVTAADIAAYGARTLDEALALLPGVYVRTGSDGVPRVDLRGFRTRQVALLLDGVPLNATSDGQFDPSFIPVERIEEIKLSGGTGSVLYGASGLAGTINIVTRDGARRRTVAARGEWRDGHAWLGHMAAAGRAGAVDGSFGMTGVSTAGVRSFTSSPTLGPTEGASRLNSDRDRFNLVGRVGVALGNSADMAVMVQSVNGSYGTPPSIIDDPADPFANRPTFERARTLDGLAAQVAGSYAVGAVVSVRGWAYRNLLNQLTDRYADSTFDPASVLTAAGTSRDRSRSLRSGLALQIGTAALPVGRLTLGLSADRSRWQEDLLDAVSAGGGGGGGGGGGKGGGVVTVQGESVDRALTEYGTALEYEARPAARLGLVAGAMYHHLTGEGRHDGAWGGSIGAAFDLTSRAKVRASFGHRFRFPALRQLFDVEVGNVALAAERADMYELGADYRIGGVGTVGVSAYRSNARGFIERSQETDLFENAERYRIQGIELETAVRPVPDALVRVRYSYLDATDRTPGREGTRLQYRPRHVVTGELHYALHRGPAVSGTVRYVEGQVYETRRSPLVQAPLPAFTLVGLRLEQRMAGTPLAFYVGADNLFDVAYEQAYGFPQQGRVAYAGLGLGR